MTAKYTNASELSRLANVSRERMRQILSRGDIPEAVRALVGDHPVWRIPCKAADKWLRSRELVPPTWVKQEGVAGRVEDIFVGR